MDKNSIIGIVLIGAILIGWSYFSKPSKEELEAAKHKQDSIALVTNHIADSIRKVQIEKHETIAKANEIISDDENNTDKSNGSKVAKTKYGIFSKVVVGENKFYTLENEKIKIKFSKRGGRPYSITLKNYQTYDSLPLTLMDGDSTLFGISWISPNIYAPIRTQEMFFDSVSQEKIDGYTKIVFKLNVSEQQYVDFIYKLKDDSYLLDFNIKLHNMSNLITNDYISFNMGYYMPRMEKGFKYEQSNSSVFYRYLAEDVDNLEQSGDDEKKISEKIEWVAFKQQFFSSIVMPEKPFSDINLKVKTTTNKDFVKYSELKAYIPYSADENSEYKVKFFFGPNKYQLLKSFNKKFDKLLPLGWGIFGWVNKYIIINLFAFLSKFIGSYGIIILLMTLIIKMGLFPFTYRSYMSTAKMRVLKPEVDEINKKFPKKEDSVKKQQAVMALYKKAGASPMGGCLPMLFQMPFLFAMFRFFPASIELRQQSFLWADDLSSYDSIFQLPFNIPMYGDHISLWVLLMTIVNFIYMEMNNKNNPQSTGMPGMKSMMYIMPLFMLVFFNSYASSLSYYYFVSLLITILQTWIFQKFIDDKAIRLRISESKKKPVKKSKFQQRMDTIAKQQKKR